MGAPLGQHFLTNKAALRKIVAVLGLKKNDWIIEIGPGHGELTELISEAGDEIGGLKLSAIERDADLAEALGKKLDKKAEIFFGNALQQLPRIVETGVGAHQSYKIVGNIPYYITGHLLRVIAELKNKPALTVLLIQKEVAERILAEPPRMNLLAASVQFWARPELIAVIPKKDFAPPPKVDSAVIKLETAPSDPKEAGNYYRAIKIFFSQPRKTLVNNVKSSLSGEKTGRLEDFLEKLGLLGLSETVRAQNLSIDAIKTLSKCCIINEK